MGSEHNRVSTKLRILKDGNYGPGDFFYHLYGVTPDEVFDSKGDQFVTVDNRGVRLITYISFFGVPGNPVPEGGTPWFSLVLDSVRSR